MKYETKLLAVLFLTAISFASAAQSLTFVGGANYTNVSYDQGSGTGLENSFKNKLGFHAGAYYDYVLKKDRRQEIVFETGLLFDSKGAKKEYEINDYSNKEVTNLYYIDIPFYIQYRYRFRNLNKVYIGIGPYAGLGLFGKTTTTQSLGDQSNEMQHKIKWGSDNENDDLKRIDYGASARIGFHFDDGLDFSASYDYGLPNIASMGETIKMRSRVLRVTVGYTFSLVD